METSILYLPESREYHASSSVLLFHRVYLEHQASLQIQLILKMNANACLYIYTHSLSRLYFPNLFGDRVRIYMYISICIYVCVMRTAEEVVSINLSFCYSHISLAISSLALYLFQPPPAPSALARGEDLVKTLWKR